MSAHAGCGHQSGPLKCRSVQTTTVMEAFAAPPEKIVGDFAFASLIAGVPIGVVLSIPGVLSEPWSHSTIEALEETGSGALLFRAGLFIVGMIVVATIVAGRRHIGYAGPFSVYSISRVFALIATSDDRRFGTGALVIELAASHLSCRYANSDTFAFPTQAKWRGECGSHWPNWAMQARACSRFTSGKLSPSPGR